MLRSIRETKTQLSALINEVEKGETVIITRHGRPVAEIVPLKEEKSAPFEINYRLIEPGVQGFAKTPAEQLVREDRDARY